VAGGADHDDSVGFSRHLDLLVLFKSGFSFTVAWDTMRENYLGSFIPKASIISPSKRLGQRTWVVFAQVKIVALGDTNRQLVSSGWKFS
jgi:hypothetical protein